MALPTTHSLITSENEAYNHGVMFDLLVLIVLSIQCIHREQQFQVSPLKVFTANQKNELCPES